MNRNIRSWQIATDDFYQLLDLPSRLKFLLRFAILAPSTHNSQPWLFKIRDNRCYLYLDETRRLPQADPIGRDLYISIGCALENFVIAARYFKVFDSLNYGPFAENNLLVEAIIKEDFSKEFDQDYESLIRIIPRRSNARGLFRKESVPQLVREDILAQVKNEYLTDGIAIHFIEDKESIREIASLTADGLKIAYNNPLFRQEMSCWINNNFSSRKEGIPGYALKMPAWISFIFPFIVRNFNIGSKLAKLNYWSLNSAPLICIITAPENKPLTWLQIGRLAERLMLELNSREFNTSIFVASIEMGDLYQKVQRIIGTNDLPQFLFVIGKIDSKQKPTPRHSVEDKILK